MEDLILLVEQREVTLSAKDRSELPEGFRRRNAIRNGCATHKV
jgi:hypothetical protein